MSCHCLGYLMRLTQMQHIRHTVCGILHFTAGVCILVSMQLFYEIRKSTIMGSVVVQVFLCTVLCLPIPLKAVEYGRSTTLYRKKASGFAIRGCSCSPFFSVNLRGHETITTVLTDPFRWGSRACIHIDSLLTS